MQTLPPLFDTNDAKAASEVVTPAPTAFSAPMPLVKLACRPHKAQPPDAGPNRNGNAIAAWRSEQRNARPKAARKPPRRKPDHRPVKIHRSYTIEEAAAVLDVHVNTVRAWIRNGLPLVDRRRPFLIHGTELVTYLKRRHARNKRPCGTGQIYCLPCRAPKAPAGGMADYAAKTTKTGDLIGLCPDCDRVITRRISWARFDEVRGELEVRVVQPHLRIGDDTRPSVNGDFEQMDTCDAD